MAMDEDSSELASSPGEYTREMPRCPFRRDLAADELNSQDASEKTSTCPFSGGFSITSFIPSFGISSYTPISSERTHSYAHSYTLPGITLESDSPISPRISALLEGLNEPGDSGNPPEPPEWLDRQLFDRGREFYRRYLFCLSFSDLLSLVLMLSADRALRTLIYTGQSDTPLKALKRYFSTLVHIVTWYSGDIWDPEDDAHKDILAVRSVHGKVAQQCNSSETNEKVTKIQVSDKGHQEPAYPLYKNIHQDLTPQLKAKLVLSGTENPNHYISQFDMSLTQYSFMGLLLAHPEKIGAGAATEEEFAGLIHFWRGVGWLLGIEDKYNFCSGSVAETRDLCLEVEKFFALPSLAQVDWNYEHMATSLMSGMHIILPNMSFPTMFRYMAYTIDVPVPSFVKRMSLSDCFQYWIMRLIFGALVFFPGLVRIFSYRFSAMISRVRSKSSGIKCPKAKKALSKNYS